ncbi:MAG: hypothetical protein ACLPHI_13155 [Terriglobales bacterium]|jgi:hypothetical protein
MESSIILNRKDKRECICARLQQLGYAREKHIRLYGQDFDLVSNPVPEGDGFVVEGVARPSGNLKRMRIPLSLIYTLKKQLAAEDMGEHSIPLTDQVRS